MNKNEGMIKERVQLSDHSYIRSMRHTSVWACTLFCVALALPGAARAAGEGTESTESLIRRADGLMAKGEVTAAVAPLREATLGIRRNSGLYDLRQYDLLLKLVDAQSQVGDLDAAAADLSYLQRISENGYGVDSFQHGRALSQIASWQCRIGQFMQSREDRKSVV